MDSAASPNDCPSTSHLRQQLHLVLDQELDSLTEFFASRSNRQLLGEGEFLLRDLVHRLGAKLLQTALEERKKGATKAPPFSVPPADNPPNSKSIVRAKSAASQE